MNKLFKLWKYRLEIKLSKMSDKDRIEFLANKLVEDLNLNIDPDCELITLWIHNKEKLSISCGRKIEEISCKYTGK